MALIAPKAIAQDLKGIDGEILNGIPVRSIEDVAWTEKVGMLLERVLVPTRQVAAPLYAYDSSVACERDLRTLLAGNDGAAAILVDFENADSRPVALYRPSVEDAVRYAESRLCGNGDASLPWYFATTHPLGGIEEKGRYLSRDVERVEQKLRESHASLQQKSPGLQKEPLLKPPGDQD